jgi:hypothetical protein
MFVSYHITTWGHNPGEFDLKTPWTFTQGSWLLE